MNNNNTELIDSLRKLTDFLEQHPTLPVVWTGAQINAFVYKRDELIPHARITNWKKDYNALFFSLKRDFGTGVTFEINIEREHVCRPIVVGKKTIAARPEQVVDDVQWVCDDSLLAEKVEA